MNVIFYAIVVFVSVFAGILIHALLTASATADLRAQVEQLEAELNFWASR